MELSLEEATLHQAYERIADAHVALDREWRYTYANAKACELIGVPASELIGRFMWDIAPGTADHPFRYACEQALARQQPVFLEAFYERSRRWYESHIHPTADGVAVASEWLFRSSSSALSG